MVTGVVLVTDGDGWMTEGYDVRAGLGWEVSRSGGGCYRGPVGSKPGGGGGYGGWM